MKGYRAVAEPNVLSAGSLTFIPITPQHSTTHTLTKLTYTRCLMRGAGYTARRPAHTTLGPARVVSSARGVACLTTKLHRAVAAGRSSKRLHNQQLNLPVTCKAAIPLASGTEPHTVFLARLAWEGVLLPVLASWLFVTALSTVASRARRVGCQLHARTRVAPSAAMPRCALATR